MITITAPVKVYLKRKTKDDVRQNLNMNQIKTNSHKFNETKKTFTDLMKDQLKGLKLKTPIDITYWTYYVDNRSRDRDNVVSIVKKFFQDALKTYKCIPDDKDKYISGSHEHTGGIDKDNPRVDIEIRENVKPKERDVK
jgi:Holliday junction resolvase RusA-like endonuclease